MKVKNIMFSGFMAVVLAGVCGAASAAADMTGDGALVVASKGYVDAKVTTLNSKDTELSGKITELENANKAGGAVADAIAAAQTAADDAQSDVDTLAGKMNLDSADSELSQALALKENSANKLDSSQIDLLNTDGTVNKDAVNALGGNDTKFPTVGAAVEIANAKAQQVLENVNSVSANLGTLTSKVDEHTASIEKLEGGADVTGSVANAIKQSKDYADGLVTAEENRAKGEEGRIEGLVTAETQRAEAAEAKALSDANAYTDSQVSTLTSQTADNTGAIAQLLEDVNEAGVAINDIAKEGGTIDQKVSALETKLMDDANGTVTAAIKVEADRAKGEESRIEGLVTAEENRAKGEESRIEGLVTAEANRADAAEKANAQAISNEKSRAEGKEAELATAIADETSRAELAEQGLQTAINTINDGTNGIYAKAKQYTDAGLTTIYSNASECIAASPSNNCILSARTGTGGNPMYVWISLTAPAE